MASISKKILLQSKTKYYYIKKILLQSKNILGQGKEGTKERRKCICANVCYAPACPNSPKIRFMVKYPSPGGWRGDTWYIISIRSIWYRRYRQSMGGILYPKFWNSVRIIGTTYILYVGRDGWGMRSTEAWYVYCYTGETIAKKWKEVVWR